MFIVAVKSYELKLINWRDYENTDDYTIYMVGNTS